MCVGHTRSRQNSITVSSIKLLFLLYTICVYLPHTHKSKPILCGVILRLFFCLANSQPPKVFTKKKEKKKMVSYGCTWIYLCVMMRVRVCVWSNKYGNRYTFGVSALNEYGTVRITHSVPPPSHYPFPRCVISRECSLYHSFLCHSIYMLACAMVYLLDIVWWHMRAYAFVWVWGHNTRRHNQQTSSSYHAHHPLSLALSPSLSHSLASLLNRTTCTYVYLRLVMCDGVILENELIATNHPSSHFVAVAVVGVSRKHFADIHFDNNAAISHNQSRTRGSRKKK